MSPNPTDGKKTLLIIFDGSIYPLAQMANLSHGLYDRGYCVLLLSSGNPPVDLRIFDLDKLEDKEKEDIYAAVAAAKLIT